MYEWHELALIAGTFLLAGGVKGVVGMGMPTVSLAILTATIGLTDGLALIVIPTTVTNVWQAFSGGPVRDILARHWLFLGAAIAMVLPGAMALTFVDLRILSALLGAVLIIYSLVSLGQVRVHVPARQESWLGALSGGLTGLMTGMTGSSVVPGVLFLQSLGLPRAQLVQAMGMLFAVCAIALALALGQIGIVNEQTLLLSTGALVPALAGMKIGQTLGRRMSEAAFRRVLYFALLLLGFEIIASALL
jgi:uncharacterized membrane protein YfcA